MNPTACLLLILERLHEMHQKQGAFSFEMDRSVLAEERDDVLESMTDLFCWIRRGGFAPSVEAAIRSFKTFVTKEEG